MYACRINEWRSVANSRWFSPSTPWNPRIKHRPQAPCPLINPTGPGSQTGRWELGFDGDSTLLCSGVDLATQPEDMSLGLRGRGEESQRLIR